MKNLNLKTVMAMAFGIIFLTNVSFAQKLITKSGHAQFFSHTVVEDIQAHNYKVTSSINTETGKMVFSVPMQSFEFEKSLMQKHFNKKKFLSTKKFPKAKFKGNITNIENIDFSNDGTYDATVEGDLTIRGETQHVSESGTITVKSGKVSSSSSFDIVLGDYGIAFKKGKPSKNIAKSVKITIDMEY